MDIIAKVFENRPDVEFAYLFGSVAMGTERMESDMDIAVYLNDQLFEEQMGQYRLELIDLLEETTGRKIDLVILNTASLKLIHQVLMYGKIIYVENEEKEKAFAWKKRKEYLDFKYYIDRDLQEMRTFYGS